MEILRNGRKPEEIVLYGKCDCGCEFVVEEGEYVIENTIDGAVYVSRCPCCIKIVNLTHKTRAFVNGRKPSYLKDKIKV